MPHKCTISDCRFHGNPIELLACRSLCYPRKRLKTSHKKIECNTHSPFRVLVECPSARLAYYWGSLRKFLPRFLLILEEPTQLLRLRRK